MTITVSLEQFDKEPQVFSQGQEIFREGNPGTIMYVVKEGRVDVLKGDRVIDSAGPGEILGEMALIDSSPRSATARAGTDCKLIPVDEYYFLFLVQHSPYFALQVMRILAARLRARMAEKD